MLGKSALVVILSEAKNPPGSKQKTRRDSSRKIGAQNDGFPLFSMVHNGTTVITGELIRTSLDACVATPVSVLARRVKVHSAMMGLLIWRILYCSRRSKLRC